MIAHDVKSPARTSSQVPKTSSDIPYWDDSLAIVVGLPQPLGRSARGQPISPRAFHHFRSHGKIGTL